MCTPAAFVVLFVSRVLVLQLLDCLSWSRLTQVHLIQPLAVETSTLKPCFVHCGLLVVVQIVLKYFYFCAYLFICQFLFIVSIISLQYFIVLSFSVYLFFSSVTGALWEYSVRGSWLGCDHLGWGLTCTPWSVPLKNSCYFLIF